MRTLLFLFFIHGFNSIHAQSLLNGLDAEPLHPEPVLLQQFNNPAMLASQRQIRISAGQQRLFMMDALSRNYLNLQLPFMDVNAFAISMVQNGSSLFRERYILAGYSRRFTDVLDVYQGGWMYAVRQGEGYGHKTVYGSRTSLSAFVSGLRVSTVLDIPVIRDSLLHSGSRLKGGVAIRCSEKCWLEGSGTLQAATAFFFSGGIFYQPDEKFQLRMGVITQPLNLYLGFAVVHQRWTIDLTTRHHPVLGFSPGITLAYNMTQP